MMKKIEREIRGIPFFLLMEYLKEMGGTIIEDGYVQGPGWQVELKRIEPFRIGSLEVGQSRLNFEIEDHLVDEFMELFGKKTLRAGG
jgi:hypothetical protein